MPAAMPKAMSAMSSTRDLPKTNTPNRSYEYTGLSRSIVLLLTNACSDTENDDG